MESRYAVVAVMTLMVAALGLAGCRSDPVKMTAGGWIPSKTTGKSNKANFGFNASSCSECVTGQFNYHDKPYTKSGTWSGGLMMNGFIVHVGNCDPLHGDYNNDVSACTPLFCLPGMIGVDVYYTSTNPKVPGGGYAWFCVDDNGEGSNADPDTLKVKVLSGPYDNYANYGNVQGNVQEHACDCLDGIDNDADGVIDAEDVGCQLVDGVNGSEVDL